MAISSPKSEPIITLLWVKFCVVLICSVRVCLRFSRVSARATAHVCGKVVSVSIVVVVTDVTTTNHDHSSHTCTPHDKMASSSTRAGAGAVGHNDGVVLVPVRVSKGAAAAVARSSNAERYNRGSSATKQQRTNSAATAAAQAIVGNGSGGRAPGSAGGRERNTSSTMELASSSGGKGINAHAQPTAGGGAKPKLRQPDARRKPVHETSQDPAHHHHHALERPRCRAATALGRDCHDKKQLAGLPTDTFKLFLVDRDATTGSFAFLSFVVCIVPKESLWKGATFCFRCTLPTKKPQDYPYKPPVPVAARGFK